jgi:hypothetical protein
MLLALSQFHQPMGLYHPLDGDTNLRYKLLSFLTPNKKISKKKALAFNRDRCCYLVLYLGLVLFHLRNAQKCQHKVNGTIDAVLFHQYLC